MRFEPDELYLESSLFLLKARLCYDQTNVQRQQGDGHISLSLVFFFLFVFLLIFSRIICISILPYLHIGA